ncbi:MULTISPECIES: LysR family transcriptional regulator [Lactiplantibacillus]|uniref:LysR family transcriptional regulator n=1 Tax=Lactiplantibacillus paraplantarum TaxID=60520 RepID=A0AAD0TXV5_9LACO|nr:MULTISPECIES: LysR family transcriptional regulator [Lactiplantibacillus]AVW11331.1 LysR family transcriptional regulator [Lactiplantibacillus paraplantarum]AYJ39745.1 LysR family transcriptional regulator [Lactiplantibacillus paraplantarum]ERL44925.1 transcription regulator [Lactiplantibacillus paraplantarum]KRL50790.1 transcription regulator [Lactiplantibacillus paraplantarum DSM 10667]MDL2062990.1 LysR family transcriptional regulator [Lactiplantibacillus paraplantarum]
MFQQMQYFIAIVKNHSFTQAAVDCHISQSAISQQMKELESRLGLKLIKRQGRSFEVTEAGQYFYTHSQDILADVEQLVENTIKIEKNDEAELRVGYLRSFGTTEFLQTVSEFTREFPKVKIKISSGTHEDLYELLRTGQIDLNLSDQRRALSNEYQNEFLTASEFMVAVNHALPVDTEKIDIAALVDLPCILIIDGSQQAAEESYYRDVLGVKSEFVRAQNYDEAQMLVASNQGYLIINQRMRTQLDQDVVKMIPLFKGHRNLIQNYYAYWQADNSGYYIETFAELLKQNFA